MKPTKPGAAGKTTTFAPPTPKVSRQQRGKVLTPAEKAAFLASRPDLKPKEATRNADSDQSPRPDIDVAFMTLAIPSRNTRASAKSL